MERGYTAGDIVQGAWPEPIRQRPQLWVGADLGAAGVHRLVHGLLENVLDEALEGGCTRAAVRLDSDGSVCVSDEGRGIPVAPHGSGRSTLEAIFCDAGACYCGCDQAPGHRRPTSGPAVCVINALSAWLVVESARDGERHRMRFERGQPVTPLESRGAVTVSGTKVHFQPDRSIFAAESRIDPARLRDELLRFVALAPHLDLTHEHPQGGWTIRSS